MQAQLDVANTTLKLLYFRCSPAAAQLCFRGSCGPTSDVLKGRLLGRILKLTREKKEGKESQEGGGRRDGKRRRRGTTGRRRRSAL